MAHKPSNPEWSIRPKRLLRALRGRSGTILGLLLVIWVILPLLPEETGLRFGMGYRAFFTVMVLLATLFFWFLEKDSIPQPRSPACVLAALGAVCALTVGSLVLVGVVYPQFQRPEPPGAAAQSARERGKELFWGTNVGCFRCHTIGGTGGTRGPDLSRVAARAGDRVVGLTAEQYLRQKIAAGATYQFKVPEFAPIMPPFGQMLSEEQVNDLVAYLIPAG